MTRPLSSTSSPAYPGRSDAATLAEATVQPILGARLAAVITAAASFPERVSSEYFVPVLEPDSPTVQVRVRRWLRAAAQDDEAVRVIMSDLATQGLALGAGFRTVRLADPSHLPAWARALRSFVSAQPPSFDDAATSGASTTLLTSFERAARVLLARVDGRIEGVEVSDDGYAGMVADLVSRLIDVCDPTLRLELKLLAPGTDPLDWLDAPQLDGTQAGWLARLEALPGLAFVVGLAAEQWRAGTAETLRRLKADTPLLRQELFDREDIGPLVGYRGGAGDRHAGGRSVALLRFASGQGVVYKPKDLRHTEATMDVIGFLNGAGLPLTLATRGVVCRGDSYGWEERVEPAPVEDRAGFSRFYRRLGMLMRLMQLLDGRDLWADNLLAVGDQPHLIDLECLFSPPINPPPLLPTRRQALADRMETTVLRTAMALQAWLPSPECPTRDVGCLSHAANPPGAGGGLPLGPYRPWVETETADPWNHADDVTGGYREMHDLLVANRTRLIAADSPLQGFAGARMRYIWRSTWDCHRAVRASVSPGALVDGVSREYVLAAAVRSAHLPVARQAGLLNLPEIASAEVNALRQLDVPMFASSTTSSSLFTPDETEIVGHFAGTAWSQVRRRVANLHQAPIDTDVALLRAAIDGARGGLDIPSAAGAGYSRKPRSEDDDVSVDEVVDAAQDIADLLVGARQPPLGTGDGWIALMWWPAPEMWEVGPAGADLISGALGPVLYLAEHFAVTGDPRSWSASRETLDELLELSTAQVSTMPDPRLALGAAVPGGLAGPGALAYVEGRVAASLGDASILAAARMHVEHAAVCSQAGSVGLDLPFGLAGFHLQLLRLRTTGAAGDVDLDALAAGTAARLVRVMAGPGGVGSPVPSSSRLSELVPTGRDGVALALARTIADAPELLTEPSAAMAALSTHSFESARRGARLAAMAVHACGTLTSAPPTAVRPSSVDLPHLSTRSLVSRAEEGQLASWAAGDSNAAIEARRCLRVLIDRRRATGRWFPDRLVDDRLNLSPLDGLSALGSVLLREIRPELPFTSVLG